MRGEEGILLPLGLYGEIVRVTMSEALQTMRRTRNLGLTHVFLGDPMSDGRDKTTVEPGNAFSPGVWTCGVSTWFRCGDLLATPDLLSHDEVTWGFGRTDGFVPVISSEYDIGRKLHITNRLTTHAREGSEGVDFCEVAVEALESCRFDWLCRRKRRGAGRRRAAFARMVGGAVRPPHQRYH